MRRRYSKRELVNKKYRILDDLGEGGMGVVVLVEPIHGKGRYALKYCSEEDEEGARRFAREVRAMKRVNHPNVITVLDADLDHTPPYFVMPLAEHSLAKEIAALSSDHTAALATFLQICDGVEAIHASVGPHRDLKPLNTLRLKDGTVAVSDFGLVKFDPRDTTTLTRASISMGTPAYMAPEMLRHGGTKDADERVDVYALGAMLYEFLTGDTPPPAQLSELPPPLAHIITKAMAPLVAERYATVAEFAGAVRRVQRMNQRGKDPRRILIELRTTAITAFIDQESWDEESTGLLLQAVRGLLGEPHVLRDEFDRIPTELLAAAAPRLPDAMADALDAYCAALAETAGGMNFVYAEDVATMMSRVLKSARRPDVKANAIRAALIAAVDLRRYAAMDKLESMIRGIKRDETAIAVAAMLRREGNRFAVVAQAYRSGELHRLIRDVVDEVLAPEVD